MTLLAEAMPELGSPRGVELADVPARPYLQRCVGGCGAQVSRRGAWCRSCGERDLAAIRAADLAPAYDSLPDWPWARFSNPKFLERLEQNGAGAMLKAAREWRTPAGHVAFIGRTGIGKTALMVAVAHQILDMARDQQLSERAMVVASGVRFISAVDLGDAARRWPPRDADNAPLVQAALDATVLILDELGHEDPKDRSVFKVIDSRMRARGRNTLITSRLTRREMEGPDRYGKDGARRVFDCGGVVVDLSRPGAP